MIINQETPRKMDDESMTYKALCFKLCTTGPKIVLDKFILLCL